MTNYFLSHLKNAVDSNEEKTIDNILQAIRLVKVHTTLNYYLSDKFLADGYEINMFMYTFKNYYPTFKKLAVLFKGENVLIPPFYKSIFTNNLDAVKFFVEEVDISLFEPSIGFKSKWENALTASDENLDIFRYLLPFFIVAYHNNPEKNIITNLIEPTENYIKLQMNLTEILSHELKLLAFCKTVISLFQDYKLPQLSKDLSTQYMNDKFLTLILVGSLLGSLGVNEEKIKKLNSRQLGYFSKIVTTLYEYIQDEEEKDKLELMSVFKDEILPDYLGILTAYYLSRNVEGDEAYKSATEFLVKKDIVPSLGFMKGSTAPKKEPIEFNILSQNNNSIPPGGMETVLQKDNNVIAMLKDPSLNKDVLDEIIILFSANDRLNELNDAAVALALEGNHLALGYIEENSKSFDLSLQFDIHAKLGSLYCNQENDTNNIALALKHIYKALNIHRNNSNDINSDKFNALFDQIYKMLKNYIESDKWIDAWENFTSYLMLTGDADKISQLIILAKIQFDPDTFTRLLKFNLQLNIKSIIKAKETLVFSNLFLLLEKLINDKVIDEDTFNSNPPIISYECLPLISKNFSLENDHSIEVIKLLVKLKLIDPFEISELLCKDLNHNSGLHKPYSDYIEIVGLGAAKGCKRSLGKLDAIFLKICDLDTRFNAMKIKLAEQYNKLKNNNYIFKQDDFHIKSLALTSTLDKRQELVILRTKLNAWVEEAQEEFSKCKQTSNSTNTSFFNKNPQKPLNEMIFDGINFAYQVINIISTSSSQQSFILLNLPKNNIRNVSNIEDIYQVIHEYLNIGSNSNSKPSDIPVLSKLHLMLSSLQNLPKENVFSFSKSGF